MPLPRLGLEFAEPGETQISTPLNDALKDLGLTLNAAVISATTLAEPGSPASGDLYLLPASGALTGTNWSTYTNGQLVLWDGLVWYRRTVYNGVSVLATDTGRRWTRHGGAWVLDDTLRGTRGADIASATTTNLATATGDYVHITGTTTITGFGSPAAASTGLRRLTRFTGILILTHHATNLICLTGANITTAAGDLAAWVWEGTGWRMVSYTRADGTGLVAGSGAPFDDGTAIIKGSADATKLLRFEVDGFTTATTRVATPPNSDFTMAGINIAQTFTATQTFTPAVNTSALVVTGASLTGTDATSFLSFAGTFNTTGTPTFLDVNLTDMASNAASLLFNLRVGSSSKLAVTKTGKLLTGVGFSLATADQALGDASGGLTFSAGSTYFNNGGSSIASVRSSNISASSTILIGWSPDTASNSAPDTSLCRVGVAITGIRAGSSANGGALSFVEQTAPAAPAANGVYIYSVDNGAGKTQLMALFGSGAAQQIAIEP